MRNEEVSPVHEDLWVLMGSDLSRNFFWAILSFKQSWVNSEPVRIILKSFDLSIMISSLCVSFKRTPQILCLSRNLTFVAHLVSSNTAVWSVTHHLIVIKIIRLGLTKKQFNAVRAGITTGWRIGVRGFESWQWLGIFLLSTASIPALESTPPPIKWIPGALSLGAMQPGREVVHSPLSSAEVKNVWSYNSATPIRIHGVVLS